MQEIWQLFHHLRHRIIESRQRRDKIDDLREAEGLIRTWKMSVEEKLKAVIDNKHVPLPWLVTHAGLIITRYKTVHDGKTAYQRIKNKRPSNKMLPFGEKVVWMMSKDNHKWNKLDSIHQFGMFVGIVSRTGEIVVLTLEGAVAVRTVLEAL